VRLVLRLLCCAVVAMALVVSISCCCRIIVPTAHSSELHLSVQWGRPSAVFRNGWSVNQLLVSGGEGPKHGGI